jgi:hypothetical protein
VTRVNPAIPEGLPGGLVLGYAVPWNA